MSVDDIVYAGSEMNVDTDEFLKSLKSLQVSPCECSAKNPDPATQPAHESLPQIPDDALLVPARDRPEPAAPLQLYTMQAAPSPATPSIKYTGSITATACTPISTNCRNHRYNC